MLLTNRFFLVRSWCFGCRKTKNRFETRLWLWTSTGTALGGKGVWEGLGTPPSAVSSAQSSEPRWDQRSQDVALDTGHPTASCRKLSHKKIWPFPLVKQVNPENKKNRVLKDQLHAVQHLEEAPHSHDRLFHHHHPLISQVLITCTCLLSAHTVNNDQYKSTHLTHSLSGLEYLDSYPFY